MGSSATVMDLAEVWAREQEVWKHTGKNAVTREEADAYAGLGPLSYAEYKPPASGVGGFEGRYLERVQKFVRQGAIGAAAAPGTPSSAAPPASATTNVYSHLLRETSVHKHLQAKVDALGADGGLVLRAGSRDFVPSALALSLPKTYPTQLKPGEPMGISLGDVHNIRSLMADLEQVIKQTVALKQQPQQPPQQQQRKPAPPVPEHNAPAPAAAAAASAPMDVDHTGAVKSEGGVKTEPGVKQEDGGVTVKKEEGAAAVKSEPMDTGESVKIEPGVARAAPAAPIIPVFPNPVSLLPVLPTSRIVQLDVQFISVSSGAPDVGVRFRFARDQSSVPLPPNFTPQFLATMLTQQCVNSWKAMSGLGDRMVEWHRAKAAQLQASRQQQLHQQQAQMMARQQQQQQQQAAAAAAASLSARVPHPTPPPAAGEESAAKRIKVEGAAAPVTTGANAALPPQLQQLHAQMSALSSRPAASASSGDSPSSSPLFDRSRLSSALRHIPTAVLDRLIQAGCIAPDGTMLAEAGVIIARLRAEQPTPPAKQ